MAYNHGVRVMEVPTSVIAPLTGTAGLQVVFGTAPVNLADDPYSVTNTPVIAYSWDEAVSKLGYSGEKDDKGHFLYTLCGSMYASFKLVNIAPVVFINVLDPTKHKKTVDEQTVTVTNKQATVTQTGILLKTVKVSHGEDEQLTPDTDYLLAFDDDGYLEITLTDTGAEKATEGTLKVTGEAIDPSKVDKDAIIGLSSGGSESGLECIRQVYPKLGMTPGLIVAPGWSHMPEVAAVMAAKCEEINGYFTCEALIDIDSSSTGNAPSYDKVKEGKEKTGVVSKHVMACWPCVASGEVKFWYSCVLSAITAYLDANNDDVPYLSPSNQMFSVTGTVLSDAVYTPDENGGGTWDKEVALDQVQGNLVNSYGVTTAININGWRTWGNNTAAYPANTDPKDRWFCCRRFFSWWGNSFILTYFQKVDSPMNRRLIESIVDSENIRGNSYVARNMCAAVRVEYLEAENPSTDIINGKMTFHIYLAPYVPAEDILGVLEFDVDALQQSLLGG